MPLFPWIRPDAPPAPTPVPVPTPPPDEPNPARAAWLKAWLLLRQLDKKKLGAAVFTVPVMVFLAVSGIVLWVWLFLRGVVRFTRALFS